MSRTAYTRLYALSIHRTSSRDALRSVTICGMPMFTMVRSSNVRNSPRATTATTA